MNDEEWTKKVEEHLLRDLIEDLQDRVKELESILKGEKRNAGLLAEYTRHDELLRRMYAVIWQDPTGQKGVLHDVDVLMERRKNKFQGSQFRWQFWGLILAQLIISGTTILLSWDKILKLLPKYHPGPLEQKIERARHPKSPKKIFQYRIVPRTKQTNPDEPPSSSPAPTTDISPK